jgi:hypothetical protein
MEIPELRLWRREVNIKGDWACHNGRENNGGGVVRRKEKLLSK